VGTVQDRVSSVRPGSTARKVPRFLSPVLRGGGAVRAAPAKVTTNTVCEICSTVLALFSCWVMS
jgi:hypothetical protein